MITQRIAVLTRGVGKPFPTSQAPDPRKRLGVRAGETTRVLYELVDEGMSPVFITPSQRLVLTVRPKPSGEEEKLIQLDAVAAPSYGPNFWLFTFSGDLLRRKASVFKEGFYSVALVDSVAGTKDIVVGDSLFQLYGSTSGGPS